MLLLDGIQEATEEKCIARIQVLPSAWYADADGTMPGWLGIELMAQTVAAFSGFRKMQANLSPRIGFLLGTRIYESRIARFSGGDMLEVEARLHYLDESGLSAFDCEIRHQGQWVARAILKTFEPT